MVRQAVAEPQDRIPWHALVGRDAEVDLVVGAVGEHGQALVTGEPGVGKTSLLAACARRLSDDGFRCEHATAAAALADDPLAALAHLIGPLPSASPPERGRLATEAIRSMAAGSTAVLVLDDAHQLDRWSTHAVLAARAAGGPRVLAAARSTTPLPDGVATLGRAPGVRVELQRLSRTETAAVAAGVLGDPLDTASADRIHAATDGLPLAITELVDHARRSGALVRRAGLWRWEHAAQIDRHLGELLGLRLAELDRIERDTIDLLSTVDRLPADVVRAVAPGVDLAAMEAKRLVTAAPRPGWVVPGHPLLREAAIGGLPPIRRHELLARLAAHLTAIAPDELDAELARLHVHVAVELGSPMPVERLLDAVDDGRAHGAWERTLPVMAHAWSVAPDPATGLAYAEALYWTRRPAEAVRVLDDTIGRCADPADLVRATLLRSRALHIGLGDRAAAERARAEILDATGDPALRLEILAAEADELLFLGEITAILESWAAHPPPPVDDPLAAARYRLTQSTVGALGLAGRLDDMAAEHRFHVTAESSYGDLHPLAAVAVGPWWVANNVLGGRTEAVRDLLADRYHSSMSSGDGLARPIWALPAAIERWGAGDLVAAERFAREALGIDASVVSIRRIATHFLMRVLELQGRHGEVVALAPDAFGDDYVDLVRDWAIAVVAISRAALDPPSAVGNRRDAVVQECVKAAEAMAARGQRLAAAHVLHDVVRFGAADAACEGLVRLTHSTDAPVVRWLRDHAIGLVGHDVALLERTAAAADAAGHVALGLHVLMDARRTAIAARDGAAVERLDRSLAETNARTTGWPDVDDDPAADLGLSSRELEVARAAVAGLSDHEIAEALVVSVRTVHAHLRSIYRKLDVHRRADLTDVPGLGGADRSPVR